MNGYSWSHVDDQLTLIMCIQVCHDVLYGNLHGTDVKETGQ